MVRKLKEATKVEKRQLGKSNLYVSAMGLGCMSLGTNERKAKEIISTALDEGVNYFDTADLYDRGTNEEIVGKALKPVRDKVIIATKVGNRFKDQQDGWKWEPSKSYIKEAVKDSLTRLQTDYIDLYQLHGGTMDDPLEEAVEAFEELKTEGLIRSYGFSSIRLNVIRRFVDHSSATSNMMQLSLLDRRPEEILPFLKEKQVSVVTRGPLAKGLLSSQGLNKASDSMKEKGFLGYSYNDLKVTLQLLQERFSDDRSITELALQYNLALPAVASVVVGASSKEQIVENARAIKAKPLQEDEFILLQSLTKEMQYEEHRE
jgi:aryl-alcohol dehydrogenase-like predicted oxidoreductase